MLPQTLVPYIGLAAAFVTTFCWLPQAIRIIRTRDTRAISLAAYGAFTLGIALWLASGVSLGGLPPLLAHNGSHAAEPTHPGPQSGLHDEIAAIFAFGHLELSCSWPWACAA